MPKVTRTTILAVAFAEATIASLKTDTIPRETEDNKNKTKTVKEEKERKYQS
jgi:hypothetical protein